MGSAYNDFYGSPLAFNTHMITGEIKVWKQSQEKRHLPAQAQLYGLQG